jgi:hypothetical protein
VLVHDGSSEALRLEGIPLSLNEFGVPVPKVLVDGTFQASGNQFDTDPSMELATGHFDGDGRADVFVATGTAWFYSRGGIRPWEFLHASNKRTQELGFADIDNDGITDVLYRDGNGNLGYLKSGTAALVNFTTVPVPIKDLRFGDFDGDGKTDVTVYRPSNGVWYVLASSTNFTTFTAYQWGASTDVPVPGDFDGDGKTDIAVYRPSNGVWYILRSSNGYNPALYAAYQWGASTDIPVPGDYDGDGKTDVAVYRPANGTWYILQSSTNYTMFVAYQWGASTDTPVLERP